MEKSGSGVQLERIARVRSEFPTKFGVPRQSNLVAELRAYIVFEPAYRNPDLLRGLDAFSHLWLIWGFSETADAGWSPTVRPPKLGGNMRRGVFATRSPYRPNPLGLSSVRIERIDRQTPDGPVIYIKGADLMDNTPVYDIKPYLSFTDAHPDAENGEYSVSPLEVHIGEAWREKLPAHDAEVLRQLLAQDPRPGYQTEPDRVYGMAYRNWDVRFTVRGNLLTVEDIVQRKIT